MNFHMRVYDKQRVPNTSNYVESFSTANGFIGSGMAAESLLAYLFALLGGIRGGGMMAINSGYKKLVKVFF